MLIEACLVTVIDSFLVATVSVLGGIELGPKDFSSIDMAKWASEWIGRKGQELGSILHKWPSLAGR